MRAATRERFKTAIIAALTLSAVALGWESRMFAGFFTSLSGGSAPPAVTAPAFPDNSGTEGNAEGARPVLIVVTDEVGLRAAAQYDDAATDSLYEKTVSLLGEALASSQAFTPCGEAAWRAALGSPGVMFEYAEPVRLDVLRAWLGAVPAAGLDADGDDVTLRRFCMSFTDNTLYLQGADGFFSAPAAALGKTRPVIPTQYLGGMLYAFERGDANAGAPYALLRADTVYSLVGAANPLLDETAVTAALVSLGVPSQMKSNYTDGQGTRMYVMTAFTVAVATSGVVEYRRAADTDANAVPLTLAEAAELARRAAEPAARYAGDARLYCSEASGEDGRYTVTFDYYINGGRVLLAAGPAVKIEFAAGQISRMTFTFRMYVKTGETAQLLPALQAIAAGGEVALGYADADGTLQPFWYNKEAAA
jgi:hypothetical protein